MLERSLPGNVPLSETAEEASQTFLVGFFQPELVFVIGAAEEPFVSFLLLLGNETAKFRGFIFRMLNPVPKNGLEKDLGSCAPKHEGEVPPAC